MNPSHMVSGKAVVRIYLSIADGDIELVEFNNRQRRDLERVTLVAGKQLLKTTEHVCERRCQGRVLIRRQNQFLIPACFYSTGCPEK